MQGSDTRGSDTRGSDTRGSDTRGSDTRGSDTRGGGTRDAVDGAALGDGAIEEKARTRAIPLPEEAVEGSPGEDRQAEAESILADSEDRIAAAAEAPRPADAADERRRSEDTAQP
jgi:hypothetical protein